MARITFLGGPETGNVGSTSWGSYVFELNKAVTCTDPHIIAKARNNRFFLVEGDAAELAAEIPNPTPMPTKKPVPVEVQEAAFPFRPSKKPSSVPADEKPVPVEVKLARVESPISFPDKPRRGRPPAPKPMDYSSQDYEPDDDK